jgi:hypothetical protein
MNRELDMTIEVRTERSWVHYDVYLSDGMKWYGPNIVDKSISSHYGVYPPLYPSHKISEPIKEIQLEKLKKRFGIDWNEIQLGKIIIQNSNDIIIRSE